MATSTYIYADCPQAEERRPPWNLGHAHPSHFDVGLTPRLRDRAAHRAALRRRAARRTRITLPGAERLLNRGWATVEWAETPTKRQARYYTITRSGRGQLKARITDYERVAAAIARVIDRGVTSCRCSIWFPASAHRHLARRAVCAREIERELQFHPTEALSATTTPWARSTESWRAQRLLGNTHLL